MGTSGSTFGSLSGGLLDWYAREKKPLPWRDDPRVYWVWIGEIMSQQTTLQVVVPRFKTFVHSIPDIQSLADCPESELRTLWSGLGYYARARNIQKGARYIRDQLGGEFPGSYDGWMEVPGCGAYTSAVIASVCFGQRVPAVDGNAIRVTSRLLDMRKNVWNRDGQKRMRAFLESHIRGDFHSGDFNQALMELGQEICRKSRPLCGQCPLSHSCGAYRFDTVSLCPPLKPRKRSLRVFLDVIVLERDDGKLIGIGERREGFLTRTIGFPLETEPNDVTDSIEKFFSKMGVPLEKGTGSFEHAITNHRLKCRVVRVNTDTLLWTRALEDKLTVRLKLAALEWIEGSRLESQLSSSLDQKAWKILASGNYNPHEKRRGKIHE